MLQLGTEGVLGAWQLLMKTVSPWASGGDCLDPTVSTHSELTSQVAFTPALLGRVPGYGHVHEKVSLTWGRGGEVDLWRSKIKAFSQDLQAERADGPAWSRLSRECHYHPSMNLGW